MRKLLLVILSLSLFSSVNCYADSFEKQANYTVCFTPGEDCTGEIVDVINNAISSIWVQAYSFTSKPIARALVLAQERGVKVQVILDKQALSGKKSTLLYFVRHHIPVWIDTNPAIAHNKVMVIDETQVITGSFNFTRAAQQQNAENVLIVYDEGLARKYLVNWQRRQQVSRFYKAPTYSTSSSSFDQSDWLWDLWEWLMSLVKQLLR